MRSALYVFEVCLAPWPLLILNLSLYNLHFEICNSEVHLLLSRALRVFMEKVVTSALSNTAAPQHMF
jgi:hypothetical protein